VGPNNRASGVGLVTKPTKEFSKSDPMPPSSHKNVPAIELQQSQEVKRVNRPTLGTHF